MKNQNFVKSLFRRTLNYPNIIYTQGEVLIRYSFRELIKKKGCIFFKKSPDFGEPVQYFHTNPLYSRFSAKWPIILVDFVFLEAPNDHFAEQSFWWVGFSKKSSILVMARETLDFSGITACERGMAFYSPLVYCLRIGILHLQAMKWTVNATENTALCCICEFRTSRAMPAHIICEVLLYRSVFKLQPQTRCVAVTGNWIWTIQRA